MPPKRRNAQLQNARPHPLAQRMRKLQSKDAERKRKERARRRMARNLEALSEGLINNKGKSHTFGENQLLIFAIQNELKRAMSDANTTINSIPNWAQIERDVASNFHVRREHIIELRKGLWRMEMFMFLGRKQEEQQLLEQQLTLT